MTPRTVAAIVLGISATASLLAQSPLRFEASTDVVRVYATVKDATGHLVTDLQQHEFEVRDRSVRVPLALFSKDVQPIRVAIMVDMSGSIFDHPTFRQVRAGLSAFVDQFTPQDRGVIGWFSNERIFIGPALTADTSELKQLIDREIQFQHVHPRLASLGSGEGAFGFDFAVGRPLWNAIGTAASSLSTEPGRKVIVVLANGNNTKNLSDYPRLKELKATVANDEFMIYGIHGFEPRMADPSARRADQIEGSNEERQTTLKQFTELTGGGRQQESSQPCLQIPTGGCNRRTPAPIHARIRPDKAG